MSVGSISYSATSLSIEFLAVQFQQGTPDDEPVAQAEELTTPGVNGRRWRTLFKQFPSFQMTTISEATTYSGVQLLKAAAEKSVQGLVTLRVLIDGNNLVMKEAHVSAVACRLFPGQVYGVGAGTNAAHIEITWQIELTDFASV